jgi:hypothetical protein
MGFHESPQKFQKSKNASLELFLKKLPRRDYGVWGDVIQEQKTDKSDYRFGYQGQFAEKDEETGWHHFELRGI